jgi:hypothetical protein
MVHDAEQELKDRIRRLENLVRTMSSARATCPAPKPNTKVGNESQEGVDTFWEDLLQEVSTHRIQLSSK